MACQYKKGVFCFTSLLSLAFFWQSIFGFVLEKPFLSCILSLSSLLLSLYLWRSGESTKAASTSGESGRKNKNADNTKNTFANITKNDRQAPATLQAAMTRTTTMIDHLCAAAAAAAGQERLALDCGADTRAKVTE